MHVRKQRTGTFDVVLDSYYGMTQTIALDVERGDVVGVVRDYLRRMRREGFCVERIGKGRFEVTGGDDAGSVSDDEGIVSVRSRVRRYRVLLGRRIYLDG